MGYSRTGKGLSDKASRRKKQASKKKSSGSSRGGRADRPGEAESKMRKAGVSEKDIKRATGKSYKKSTSRSRRSRTPGGRPDRPGEAAEKMCTAGVSEKDIQKTVTKSRSRAGRPDMPGEARQKMIAAGVMTKQGKFKEIVGHKRDSSGSYKFVAAGDPLTHLKAVGVTPFKEPTVSTKAVIEKSIGMQNHLLTPTYDTTRTSGTQYRETVFDPIKPDEKPSYFSEKLDEWNRKVSKIIPSRSFYSDLGRPVRERFGLKQPEILNVPLAFTHSAYDVIEKKPVSTVGKAAIFAVGTKGLGAGATKLAKVSPVGKTIASKGLPVASSGIGVMYSADVIRRINEPIVASVDYKTHDMPIPISRTSTYEKTVSQKASTAGVIFAGEILPMGVGGFAGIQKAPTIKTMKIPKPVKKVSKKPQDTELNIVQKKALETIKFRKQIQKDFIETAPRTSPEFKRGSDIQAAKVRKEALESIAFKKQIQKDFIEATPRTSPEFKRGSDIQAAKVRKEALESVAFKRQIQKEFIETSPRTSTEFKKGSAIQAAKVRKESVKSIAFKRQIQKDFIETPYQTFGKSQKITGAKELLLKKEVVRPVKKPVTFAEPKTTIISKKTQKALGFKEAPKSKVVMSKETQKAFGIVQPKLVPIKRPLVYAYPQVSLKDIVSTKSMPENIFGIVGKYRGEKKRDQLIKGYPSVGTVPFSRLVSKKVFQPETLVLPETLVATKTTTPKITSTETKQKIKKEKPVIPVVLPPKKKSKRKSKTGKKVSVKKQDVKNPIATVEQFMFKVI